MMLDYVIDSHAHCGIQDQGFSQSFEDYLSFIKDTPIQKVVMFAPVMEIYDRYDYHFKDTPDWQKRRTRANNHLLDIGNSRLEVIPYFFIWNDFKVSQLTKSHKGIKWHRHASEPEYQYDTPQCKNAIAQIKKRKMPVVLEEELNHTIVFIRNLAPGVRVIIPHLGGLNGGYEAIKSAGLWQMQNVYGDTALAAPYEISDYIINFGHDRLLFGSDFPFGDPKSELEKVMALNLEPAVVTAVTQTNITRLLSDSNL